jgi:hypothetical protein
MRLLPLPLLLAALASGAFAQNLPCLFTAEPASVDGILNEPVWRLAPPLSFAVPVTHALPSTPAWARMAWSSGELFVAFSASDEDLSATRTERDSDCFRDDCFEVFVMPHDIRSGYHSFETNLLGVTHDGMGGGSESFWNCPGLRIATRTLGTVNSPEDRDTGWTMEVAIPFAQLDALGGVLPRAGDTWRFNLARRDVDPRWPGGYELSCTAPVSIVSFHDWPEWPAMVFAGP